VLERSLFCNLISALSYIETQPNDWQFTPDALRRPTGNPSPPIRQAMLIQLALRVRMGNPDSAERPAVTFTASDPNNQVAD
jgi:hypothetical protein